MQTQLLLRQVERELLNITHGRRALKTRKHIQLTQLLLSACHRIPQMFKVIIHS
jgi:hypothetical protein